jgi:hypothetical protein
MKLFLLFFRNWSMSLLVVLLFAGGLTAVYADNDDEDRGKESRVKIGRAIAPVPLDLQGKKRGQVWLGSYIVNAQGGCNDCHTFPSFAAGGDPFAGQFPIINSAKYLAGGAPFGPPGGLVSKNLTPDANGRPAGLTYEQFETTMRTGRDAEDGHILQVMPWPVYGQMTDHDLRAIYEYLSAIPSLPNNY